MKNKFKILLTSMIFCLCLISVPLILSGCNLGKGNGGDGNIQINTINYDFTYYGLESYFDNYKLFDCLTQNEKLTNLPTLKTGVSGSLEGWYIKGTNTKVEENQEIESDVTLVAKWNIPPAGLYQNNYLKSIIDFLNYLFIYTKQTKIPASFVIYNPFFIFFFT